VKVIPEIKIDIYVFNTLEQRFVFSLIPFNILASVISCTLRSLLSY